MGEFRPDGYVRDPEIPFTVNAASDDLSITVPNRPFDSPGNLIVNKVDENGDPLSGACFAIFLDEGGGDPGPFVAEQCDFGGGQYVGQFVFSDLDPGNYVVIESLAPAGYIAGDSRAFTLSAEQATVLTIENVRGGATLTVSKVDENGDPLLNSCFHVRVIVDPNRSDFFTGSCDNQGPGTNDGTIVLRGLPPGDYFLFESFVPDGYVRAADIPFTVNAASADLSITVENVPIQPATIGLTVREGPIGTLTQVQGGGFAPGETVYLIWNGADGTVLLRAVTASSSGLLGHTVRVPIAGAGTYAIIAVGLTSDAVAAAGFTILPAIQLTVREGPAGTLTQVQGSGFAPGETVYLVWNGANGPVLLRTVTASSAGLLGHTVRAPIAAAGTYAIIAVGVSSDAVAAAGFTILPAIQLTVREGPVGTVTQVRGSGFAPGETVLLIWYGPDGPVLLRAVTTSSAGILGHSVQAPSVAPGVYAIVAVGLSSDAVAVAGFNVLPPPAEVGPTARGGPGGTAARAYRRSDPAIWLH